MTLGLYLSLILGGRIVAATLVLLALGLSLDLVKAADDLVAVGGAWGLLHYALLRSPAMGAQILPLGVLVGALLAFLALARRSELTVMRAAGQSVFRLLVKLAPLAVLLGVVQHLLVDQGTAWSERELAEAFSGIAETPLVQTGSRVTGRVGDTVIIGELATRRGAELSPLTVYALDDDGQVTGRLDAARATWFDATDATDSGWRLEDAHRVGVTPPATEPDLLWPSRLDPDVVRSLASGAATATAREASEALSGVMVATRSTSYYRTRLARAWSALLVPAVMLMCAAFASFKSSRGRGGLGLAATGAVFGLGFVMVDGLFGSFGQVGLIAAWVAAWMPALLFGITAGWVLLLREA